MKIARIIKYDSIKSRITIYFTRVKSDLSNIRNKCQIVDRVLFKNRWSKRDRKSKNETIFAYLLQLSARRLIRTIIHDWIRFEYDHVNIYQIIRLHD
jgi:hypothetical protein